MFRPACFSVEQTSKTLPSHQVKKSENVLVPVTPWSITHQAPPGRGLGSYSLLQGIFVTQGLNLGLLHCRQLLYHWATWEAAFIPDKDPTLELGLWRSVVFFQPILQTSFPLDCNIHPQLAGADRQPLCLICSLACLYSSAYSPSHTFIFYLFFKTPNPVASFSRGLPWPSPWEVIYLPCRLP